jgi:quinoprotein glucose dehydrogenase
MPCGGPENEFGVGFGMEADRLARRLEHREFACLHGLGNGEASATANPIPARSSGPIDTHSTLEALTQPDLKTRGVAYWQAASPRPGTPCQKIVYIGTMDAKLHAVDADTGKKCEGFADGGVLDINQWNEINAKWPLSVLQPPTVYKDTLFIGWAGKNWYYAQDPPGNVFAVHAQSGELKRMFDVLPPEAAKKTGTANVWASMSIDQEHGILYRPVSSPSPNF